MTHEIAFTQQDIDHNRVWGALSYLWVLCFLVIALRRKSPFALYHAKQGLSLFVLETIFFLLLLVPGIGMLFFIIYLCMSIYGFLQALMGKIWEVPFIGQYARDLNIS